MEKWEIALEKFLISWKENEEVTGIIVCGSYITGNPSKHSDIDLHIILKRGCKWRERGNKIANKILIEYFANPPEQIEKYMLNDYKNRRQMDAHMFATGKIILDKEGEVKKLKEIAKQYLNKIYEEIPNFKIELSKYHLFDMADNLEEVYGRKTSDFKFVYYNFLNKIFETYSEFIKFVKIGENKTYRFLTDKKDQKKYLISEFPDKKFKKMFIKAIEEEKDKRKLEIFKKLTKHVQNKMGGFNIDGWKIRSPVDPE